MIIKLINEPKKYRTLDQILYNRGIKEEDIIHYVNLSEEDINDPLDLGEENLKAAAKALLSAIKDNKKALIVIDCDCDGYTSGAALINYLYNIYPIWVENNLEWYMHEGKQHGLADCIEYILEKKFDLIITPDSSSNDFSQHKLIKDYGGTVIVLDHHLADKISEDAIIINNQLSNYKNKELSGVGVVWQFCRYLDRIFNLNYADNLLDLVAIGLVGDMMSLKSFETKYLVSEGLKRENIKNPFIDYMIEKNDFPLSKPDYKTNDPDAACTPMGAAFFIVPFINATTRSGTIDEKKLIFRSMLQHEAFTRIPSNKRGHKIGEEELLVLQAVRTIGNIKNRQTRSEDIGLALLEKRIVEYDMLNNKILLFILEGNEIAPEIRGLIANKFMAKYQRPCIIVTKNSHDNEYAGSMRGYTKSGLDNFKALVETSSACNWCQG